MRVSKGTGGLIGSILLTAAMAGASPTTVTLTKGVNGYSGVYDWRVNEPGKTSEWGGFLLGASYLMINQEPG